MQQQQPHRRALLAAPSGRPATGDSSSCLKERRHTPLAPAPPARRAGGRAGSSLARPLQRRRRRLPGQEGKAGAQVLPSLVELPPSESALLWPPPPEPGRGGAASLPSPAMAAAEAAAAAPLPVTVRPCRAEDCAEIARLIRELAEFEHLSEQVKISEQELCEDGFGPDPFYKCVVAEVPPECRSKGGHTIVGFGLYFFTYSTWKGRNIYMEDLYIMPEFRGKGIGKKLMGSIAEIGLEQGCTQMKFAVLDWNRSAIDFYLSKGAVDLTATEGWHTFRLEADAMRGLALGDPGQ
ncbi:thialysine N-epsilon-acetyltransferase-like isoform X1 [Hemicordylus capensis]|uniref:thialysine N-epsilon-acetyltransferase-like isoform X1 n=1 Tax=Hemicordylus capensis TaxID=884348 RepID=UPI0023043167|nr:thialysine N-epsilon-acetyltransferase-like isoform X1 [Hemicordylus capensis]XP_053121657.1 thialysine N-epsilon-acetyltransferase-like isoform X1 [Hemicordylus capensis]